MGKGSNTSIFKEYCSHLTKYKEKYGEKTVLLMQVGSFYEIYAILNDEEQLGEINIYHICNNIMNITVTPKVNQVLMGGFQMPYSEKFIRVLINAGYTVALVEQTTEGSGAERELKKILSPGTYMEYNDNTTSYIMSVYIEKISQSFIGVGISIIDVTTGNNFVYQIGENLDPNYWKDELSRLINYYSPKEYIFQTHNYDISEKDIINFWDIQSSILQINLYKDRVFQSIDYQNEFLQKVFNYETMITPIENLDMIHTHEMRHSYIYLLQYIYEHTNDIIKNIHKPQKINDIHHLSLTSNSVRQLNVIDNYSYYKGKHESLYSICDECGFIGGKRLLKERLLYPSIDETVLNDRYSRVQACMKDDFYKCLQPDIGKLTDTERSLRKMGLAQLTPENFLNTKLSYDFIIRILTTLRKNSELMEKYEHFSSDIEKFTEFHEYIHTLFIFKNLVNSDQSYFNEGIHPDLDEVSNSITEAKYNLQCISKRLSTIIDPKKGGCKFDSNDKHGYFLYCTKNRSKTLHNRFNNIPNHTIHIRNDDNLIIYKLSSDSFTYPNKDSSNVFIETPEINKLTKSLSVNSESVKELNAKYWTETMNELYTNYKDVLLRIHNFVSDLDVICGAAKVAIEYKYCKPTLIDNDKSCLVAKGIRHPIVERISTDVEYVTNDVSLGKNSKDGILLFGTNACGKSTLMKAIGLNVILAQAGFFVACDSFSLKPYTQIFTRILNNDNIFRSQSSFAVEMMELRSIFQLGDENSLILGDELCSGTETISAISIVSKSLDILSSKKSSYMITSHLHQLTDISLVKQITNLDIYHLKISCENGLLIYDRKLSEGSGPPIYGLKVCEAMGLSDDFIKGSNEILHYLTNQDKVVSTKQSHYSPKVFMDECKICNSKDNLECHHIKEQNTADEHDMIDHHHKNNKHNLVCLCKQCHDKVTYGGLMIYGWKSTSKGKQLDYEYVTTDKKQTKKFNQKHKDIVLSYKDMIESGIMTKISCLNMIDVEHGFRPSMKVFNEILSGRY